MSTRVTAEEARAAETRLSLSRSGGWSAADVEDHSTLRLFIAQAVEVEQMARNVVTAFHEERELRIREFGAVLR